MSKITLVITAKIPIKGVPAFQKYEDLVLPLLPQYGGVLEQRLRNDDGTLEVHIISFDSQSSFDDYRNSPERAKHSHIMEKAKAVIELEYMYDVKR